MNWGGFSLKRVKKPDAVFVSVTALVIALCLVFLYSGYALGVFVLGREDEELIPTFSDTEAEMPATLWDESLPTMADSARYAALLSGDGRLLWGKDAHTPAGMASTTKIMTALLAAEYIQSVGEDKTTVVSDTAAGIEGSSVYLKVGETVRLVDLLYATLLASANDAAACLAEAVAADQDAFVLLMNQRASEWGLVSTHFKNPHGLADTEHYTTAYELGVIASRALQNELFARVASTRHYTFAGEGMTRSLSNHNRMLFSYKGAIGVKTGFTKATGRCLVSAAERDGVCLIAVTLSAPNDWQDHTAMLDYGFSLLERRVLLQEKEIMLTLPVVGGHSSVAVTNAKALSVVLPKGYGELTYEIEVPSFVYAPIQKGAVLGRAVFYDQGKAVVSCELVADEAVDAIHYEKTLSERILSFFGLR